MSEWKILSCALSVILERHISSRATCSSVRSLGYPLVALLTSYSTAPNECLLYHVEHPAIPCWKVSWAHYKGDEDLVVMLRPLDSVGFSVDRWIEGLI